MTAGESSLSLDRGRCNGCGVCLEVCPHAVFALEDRRARIVQARDCMECGACQRNCAPGAIRVNAGVGCASALLQSTLTGKAPDCGGACCGEEKRA